MIKENCSKIKVGEIHEEENSSISLCNSGMENY
jgi:hypothetical protein